MKILAFLFLASVTFAGDLPELRIGSKKFPESYILAEIAAQLAESTGEAKVVRKFGLGGTEVVHAALESNAIDIYPEYTGTINEVILKSEGRLTVSQINGRLNGLEITDSLGFDDSYALAMREDDATRLGIKTISDLKSRPDLTISVSHEFLQRKDGFGNLAARYGLVFTHLNGIDHGLAYRAISTRQIDVTDVYTTDGELSRYKLRVLEDNLGYFPKYHGVFFFRQELKTRFPRFFQKIKELEGRITMAEMIRMNEKASLDNISWQQIAAEFLKAAPASSESKIISQTLRLAGQHMFLVSISLTLAVVMGIPLGILAFKYRWLGQAALVFTSVVQTIPSLALFCFIIPLVGIGATPAIIALFLYSLLPIVRGTLAGLQGIDARLNESATALGLSENEQLFLIQIPIASRSILSGVKTSAVINVGTATLGALIGAGGFGDPIVTGLSLNHIPTILSGAIPAAVLALIVHGIFELLDYVIVPKGVRLVLK